MSRYHLSEAYASIYNPRLQEDFDDNLRFIDYMLDEDIEEVVESLFWEFRDYGHSIDEAIELLKIAAEPEVIMEAYDTIVEQMLYEQMTPRQEYEAREKKAASARKLGADLRNPTAGNYINRKGGVAGAAKDITNRLGNRASRIAAAVKTGVVSKVQQAWDGAKGGMGKAKAAVSGGVSKAGEFVSQQRQAAKAKLQKLVRTGATKVGQAVRKGGATIERTKRNITGETARAKESRQRISSLSGQQTRNIQSQSSNKLNSPSFSEKSSQNARPKGKQVTAKGKKYSEMSPEAATDAGKMQRVSIERRASGRLRNRVAPGTTGARGEKKVRGGAQYDALGRRLREMFNYYNEEVSLTLSESRILLSYIIEDLIYEGYANDEYDALNIINTLNEDTLYDITQEYLFG